MRVRRPPNLVINASLGVLVLAGAGWAYQLVTSSSQPAAASADLTRTVAVSQGDVVATVTASGSVESAVTAAAEFTTSGTVTSISVKVGDTVKKGQVLAKVDPTQAQAELNAAEANLSAAYESLERAKDSGDDATVATAEAEVTSAEAAVTEAEQAVAGTLLKAPIAGTVTAINGSVGGSSSGSTGGTGGSSTSSTGFAQLANLTKMQVSASFAESDATKLKVGQTATVTWAALSGTTAQATVATIAPTATTTNNLNSYAVIATLDKLPDGIRIGQTVTVVVTVAQAENAIRVPSAAVTTVGNRRTVTVINNGTNEVREVEVGVEGDSFTQITSGLTVGEQVVIATSTSDSGGNNGFPGGRFPDGGLFPGGGAGPAGGGGQR